MTYRDRCNPGCGVCLTADRYWSRMPDDYRPSMPPECDTDDDACICPNERETNDRT
jgi:hypothetical protein